MIKRAGLAPTINNIRLHLLKWHLAHLNPLAPVDVVRRLIFKIDRLER